MGIDEPRTARASRRRKLWVAIAGLVALCAIGVPTALAIHDYTDVPDSNPFHEDISAIKDAGVTGGKTCVPPGTPPTFCPTEDITREAMAAFVHRGFGRSGLSSTSEIEIGPNATDLGSLTMTIGGVAGQTQFVKLDAVITTYIESTTGCPCSTAFTIWSDELEEPVSTFQYTMNPAVLAPSGFGDASGALTTVVQVPTASTQTFRVFAMRNDPRIAPGVPPAGDVFGIASMSAITAPFGSTGTNILGTSTVNGDRANGRGAAGRLP